MGQGGVVSELGGRFVPRRDGELLLRHSSGEEAGWDMVWRGLHRDKHVSCTLSVSWLFCRFAVGVDGGARVKER